MRGLGWSSVFECGSFCRFEEGGLGMFVLDAVVREDHGRGRDGLWWLQIEHCIQEATAFNLVGGAVSRGVYVY
jgi:hypothetical protein